MGKFIDITGQKFGRLTVIARAENNKENRAMWLCKCDCGNEKIVMGKHLRSEKIVSCGCFRKEQSRKGVTKHNQSSTKLYFVYHGIKGRCFCENNSEYYLYGARGITICEEWLNNFQAFYEWAMNSGYQEGLSIDRIDNNGNYEPNNCRWTTRYVQNRNKRSNKYITFNGQTKTVRDWSIYLGFSKDTVGRRLKDGWSIERALTEPRHEQHISKHKKRENND